MEVRKTGARFKRRCRKPRDRTIRKVLEHVRRIWFEPPEDSLALRAEAIRLFDADDSTDSRLLLSWGMTIAAYPFVGSVAEALGRLLKLQSRANRSDIQRPLREQYGDRDFVNRITRYSISSFLDWGVIAEAKKKAGIYNPARQIRVARPEQISWLAEAVLISRAQNQMAFSQLCHHPILFPVALADTNPSILRANIRLKVARQNLNEDVVFLEHTAPPAAARHLRWETHPLL